jgi:hypothetical protein
VVGFILDGHYHFHVRRKLPNNWIGGYAVKVCFFYKMEFFTVKKCNMIYLCLWPRQSE